jgi:regulator of protease activity HflC (stomatin/prohibitin superfamily)
MRTWPWILTAWMLGAAAALPLAASFVPGLRLMLPVVPSAAWLIVAAIALGLYALLPSRRWPRLLGLPGLVAAGLAGWQALSGSGLTLTWSLALVGAAAALQAMARPLTQAAAHLLAVAGLVGLALPLAGLSPVLGLQIVAGGLLLLAAEATLSAFLPALPMPVAAALAHGPRQLRRWLLAGRRLVGEHVGLRPLLRAVPWMAGGALLLLWALTGVTTLRVAEAGVLLERGAPREVLGPGLHVHAPWPWNQVVRVEYGVEHRLALSGAELPIAAGAIDGLSVQAQDRQWHRPHGREVFFLTAADAGQGDRRGVRLVEIINADLVIHWRVAADPEAIMAAALRTADPAKLLSALARRWIQGVFATQTPAGLLGADRAVLAERMRRSLAAELTRLGTGLEVTLISCEAIHPPLAAAPAFLAVQAAECEASGAVAVARIRRETMLAEAQIQIRRIGLNATATAAEALSEVVVRQRETAAEASAWREAPEAVALEKRIGAVTKGDDEGRTLTLIDHRIPLPVGLGIDLTAPMRPRHVR